MPVFWSLSISLWRSILKSAKFFAVSGAQIFEKTFWACVAASEALPVAVRNLKDGDEVFLTPLRLHNPETKGISEARNKLGHIRQFRIDPP